jgi:hypothetical protein
MTAEYANTSAVSATGNILSKGMGYAQMPARAIWTLPIAPTRIALAANRAIAADVGFDEFCVESKFTRYPSPERQTNGK